VTLFHATSNPSFYGSNNLNQEGIPRQPFSTQICVSKYLLPSAGERRTKRAHRAAGETDQVSSKLSFHGLFESQDTNTAGAKAGRIILNLVNKKALSLGG